MLTASDAAAVLDIMLCRVIVRELAEDDRYGCFCGEEPYTNGEQCPKCVSIAYLDDHPIDLIRPSTERNPT